MKDCKGQLQVTVLRKDLIRFHSLRLRDGLRSREMVAAALDAYERERGVVGQGQEGHDAPREEVW